jgi:hypothetical protein
MMEHHEGSFPLGQSRRAERRQGSPGEEEPIPQTVSIVAEKLSSDNMLDLKI